MKKLLAVLVLGLLVACGDPTNTNNANNEGTNEIEAEQMTKIKGAATVSLQKIDNNAFYETTINNKTIIIEKLTEPKSIEDITFNQLIFYITDAQTNEATVQTHLAIYNQTLNELDDLTFQTIKLEGETILIAILPKGNNLNEIYAWGLNDGQLSDLHFDDENSITSVPSVEVPMKVLKGKYIQTFNYENNNNETGWIFSTWSFEKEEFIFRSHNERVYENIDDEAITGKYLTEKWLSFDDYYLDFPYYTFTKKDKENIKKGYLPDLPYPLGTPIETVIESYTIFEEDYYDGGPYYETKDALYFYNEQTNIHSVASISGKRFTNPHEIEEILGEPKSSGRNDMYPDEIYSLYEWGDYQLMLTYDNDKQLMLMDLHSIKYK